MRKRNTFIFLIKTVIAVLTVMSITIYCNDNDLMDILPNNINVRSIIIDPYNTNVLYAGIDKAGLYRSTDNGENWAYVGTKLPCDYNIYLIAIDPADRAIYVGTSCGLYMSYDGNEWKYSIGYITYGMIFQPTKSSSIKYISTSDGSYFSTIEHTWEKNATPFPHVSLNPVAAGPSDPGITYFIMTKPDDVGIYFTDDAGIKHEWNDYGIYKSNGLGGTLEKVSSIKLSNFLMSSYNKNLMYGTNGKKLLKSIDGGVTWKENQIDIMESDIVMLAMNPSDNNILYAITSYYNGKQIITRLDYSLSRIFKTIDGGETWQIISDFPASKIVINPSNPDILYAGTQCGIFKSTNSGKTWEAHNNGIKPIK